MSMPARMKKEKRKEDKRDFQLKLKIQQNKKIKNKTVDGQRSNASSLSPVNLVTRAGLTFITSVQYMLDRTLVKAVHLPIP